MTQAAHSVPVMRTNRESPVERLNAFLDKYVLPYPVKYLTNRITILATLSMLVPLLVFANVTVLVLGINSYLNVMSVVVSSTVLLYSTLAEVRDRAAAEQREQIAARHQKILDERAEADHKRIEEIYKNIADLHDDTVTRINQSLDNIQKILIDHLEVNQAEDHAHVEEMHRAVLAGIDAHKEELESLRKLVQAAGK